MSGHREGVVYDARLVRRIWSYVRPHQRLIWLGLLLLVITSLVGLVQPWLLKLAIDRFIGPGELGGFFWIVALYLVAALLELLGKGTQTYVVDLAGHNALLDLRVAVFGRLQRLSARFYDRTPTGKLIGRVTTDVEALHEMFASGVVTILGDLLNLFAILGILFWMNWRLTLVALLIVPVLMTITLFVRQRVRSAYGAMISRRSALNAYLHEQAAGMSLVQAFRREALTHQSFRSINDDLRDAQLKSVKWESVLSAATELLGSISMGVILWYGGALALEGLGLDSAAASAGSGVTLGTLVAFVHYMDRFFGPLNDLSLKYTVMQNAMTASDRIFKLMDTDEVLPEALELAPPPTPSGAIRFRGVTFGYHPGEPVIEHLSFDVAAGERVALVGATGAGKTTVFKLLTRLYDIQEGSIELDGVDIREYALRELRSRVGIVPQDVFLFAGDILENIRLGHPEIEDAEATAAANELHLDQVVSRFPGGYREPVRERGKNLSTGERQLIAFARVLAIAPQVLVLDEATSSVDTNMERLLQEAVARVMQNRTSLIIAHRLSTIRDVDRIIVMHKGKLQEQGSHQELMAKRGFYWRLVQLQYADGEGASEG